jgi:hypothetical protein
MIHNTFLTDIPNLVAGNAVTIPAYMAFGSSGTPLVETNNAMNGEVGSRVAFDATTVDNNAITFTGTRLSTAPGASGQTLTAVGVMNSSAGGDLWASAIMSSLLHTTAFEIEINETVRFNRG